MVGSCHFVKFIGTRLRAQHSLRSSTHIEIFRRNWYVFRQVLNVEPAVVTAAVGLKTSRLHREVTGLLFVRSPTSVNVQDR